MVGHLVRGQVDGELYRELLPNVLELDVFDFLVHLVQPVQTLIESVARAVVSRRLQCRVAREPIVMGVIGILKDLEIGDSINSSFPMHQLHVLQQDVFELEIVFLRYEWFLADPEVSCRPLEVNSDFLPSSELFG